VVIPLILGHAREFPAHFSSRFHRKILGSTASAQKRRTLPLPDSRCSRKVFPS
jgi:hypothetical protein